MADLKLFQLQNGSAAEVPGTAIAVEKNLQDVIEGNLDTFLGVRFLASEHVTGKVHGGRIDTLGIDENDSPVIIEYKRSTSENVINQGLFYLDWLLDHRAEFQLLVLEKLGANVSEQIDWAAPRLVCIAGGFTRYDEHAVQQIGRNIELIRYRQFGPELLAFELVNAPSTVSTGDDAPKSGKAGGHKTVTEYLGQAPESLRELYDDFEAFVLALGDDVLTRVTKTYVGFRRLRNFACVEVHPQTHELRVFVKVDPATVSLEDGFTRDVRKIGHLGTGDLEVRIRDHAMLERAKPLLEASYDAS